MSRLSKSFMVLLMGAILLASPSLFAAKSKTSTAYDLKLTSAMSLPSAASNVSISKDGRFIYLFTFNNPGLPIVQLYENVNGSLVLRQSLDTDVSFPLAWTGYANQDFTLFSVVDIPNMVPPFHARIRILDRNFNVLVTQLFTGDSIPFLDVGRFSPDSQFLTFGFSQSTSMTTSQTVFNILRTSDLSVVSTTILPGFGSGSPLFTVNGQLYLAYQQTDGIPPPDFANPGTVQPPINSTVYKVTSTGLILVDSKPIPKFSDAPDVVSYGEFALIAHGGFCSLFPNQVNIYDSTTGLTTYQPNDADEGRVFNFDGKKLNLIVKQSVNCCNRTLIYPPDRGRTYMIGQNTEIGYYPNRVIDREFFMMAKLVKAENTLKFKGSSLPQQDALHVVPAFSADGKWLIRAGTYGYADGMTPTDDALGIHNFLLYKVVDYNTD